MVTCVSAGMHAIPYGMGQVCRLTGLMLSDSGHQAGLHIPVHILHDQDSKCVTE